MVRPTKISTLIQLTQNYQAVKLEDWTQDGHTDSRGFPAQGSKFIAPTGSNTGDGILTYAFPHTSTCELCQIGKSTPGIAIYLGHKAKYHLAF